jgi:hypothetical protein
LLIYLRKSFVKESISIAIGIAWGLIFLYNLYTLNGVWESFLTSVRILSDRSVLIDLTKTSKDISFVLLMIFAGAMVVSEKISKNFRLYSPLSFGLASGIGVSGTLLILGRFPTNYSWTAYIPLAICVCSAISKYNGNHWKRLLSIGFIVLTCSFGMPFFLTLTAYDWADRDYKRVEQLVEKNVNKNDWVFADNSTYYAIKRLSDNIFFKCHIGVLRKLAERDKLTVLILNEIDFKKAERELGGKWYDTGEKIEPQSPGFLGLQSNVIFDKYDLRVYRRDNT